jgi:hypothetical protein
MLKPPIADMLKLMYSNQNQKSVLRNINTIATHDQWISN